MSYEVKLKNKTIAIELQKRTEDRMTVKVDGRSVELGLVRVKQGSYSIILNNKVHNVVVVPIKGTKKFLVNNFIETQEVEVIDSESRYLSNRCKGAGADGEGTIMAPTPGKVVKVLVSKGQPVLAGQTVVIISAMKMESEFKALKAGIVVDVKVAEGQTVEGRQTLVVIDFNKE